jgi:ABC-2 type transport system permease protein
VNAFAGTWELTRLALRRDRWMLPAWIVTFAGVTGFSAEASREIWATTQQIELAADGWNTSAALVAMHGRIWDPTSFGAASMVKMMGFGTAFVALLAILLVIRHTRADEEVGRYELAASGRVGRYSAVTAALLVSVGTVWALSILSGVGQILAGLPVVGAMAFAIAWMGAGTVFAVIGAVAAQMATTARAARGLGTSILALAYLIRAIGDTQPDNGARWISWLSPIGWAQQVRPFAGDRFWAAIPMVFGALALVAVGVLLLRSRDLGAGILVDRPGPATGPRLTSMLALAWRQERLALLAWGLGFIVIGGALGGIASTIGDMFDNSQFQSLLEQLGGVTGLQNAFLSTELSFMAIGASAFGISAAMKMRTEEAQGRAESLLATSTSRATYALAHLTIALAGTAVLMVLGGVSVGISDALATQGSHQIPQIIGASLARLPAAWVMGALVMALFGIAGRLTAFAWVALVGIIVVGEFGPLMKFPHWTLDISPFAHTPALPGGTFEVQPLIWLTLLAIALAMLGLVAFRRRDLQPD